MFQGRQAEKAAVLSRLARPGALPGIVSLGGPPGIGKSALVYALARACRDRGEADVIVLDSRDFPHTLRGLRDALAACSGGVWRGVARRPLLLAFDTFEEMRDLEEQFFGEFLPGLGGPVLVLLSGRTGARAPGRMAGWLAGVLTEVQLAGLPDGQARGLLADLGVTDAGAASSIVDLAGGNPLVLCVAAQVHRSGGDLSGPAPGVSGEVSAGALPGEIAGTLITRMSRELRRPDVRELLKAASLVRTFDEELLAAMTGRVAPESFDSLCDLSVVRLTSSGARLHDVVRQTIATELRWRSPERYARLRRRAGEHLLGRSAAGGGHVVQELLDLVGQAIGPRRFFADASDRGVSVRPARDGDLAELEDVCRRGVHNFGWPAAQALRELHADFAVARHWFVVATEYDRVVAYSYSMPLHAMTWAAAAKARGGYFGALPAPELAAISQAPADTPAAFLIAGTVTLVSHRSAEPALRLATFTNRHVRAPNVARSYVLMPTGSPFEATAISLGLTRRLTGLNLSELTADEWILEYGPSGFASWVRRHLDLPEPESPLDMVPDEVLTRQVKLALEDLYRHDSLAQSPLVRLRCVPHGGGQGPGSWAGLRAVLLRLLDELQHAGPARDREAAALLSSYYVKRVGSHEIVAERLGLPRTTFYRRLNHGLSMLASRIRVAEAESGTETGTGRMPS